MLSMFLSELHDNGIFLIHPQLLSLGNKKKQHWCQYLWLHCSAKWPYDSLFQEYNCIFLIPDIFNRTQVRYMMEILLERMGFSSVFLLQVRPNIHEDLRTNFYLTEMLVNFGLGNEVKMYFVRIRIGIRIFTSAV